MSLKAKAHSKGAIALFLNFLDFNMAKMFKVFNIRPKEPSMDPAMAAAVALAESKSDVNFILD